MPPKKGKKKKKGPDISLYINKTPYEFGCLCTFCQKQRAVLHCPDCTDFYCIDCDTTTHNVEKRKHHIRTKLSHLDLAAASGLLTRCVRFGQHLKRIQRMCRAKFKRYFDRKTLNHYYYNPVYGSVSWKKPYCLRKLELRPFFDEYFAACCIQGMYHMWWARHRVVHLLKKQWKKVFDRRKGRFYYSYHGKSILMPKQRWKKSCLFGRRAFPYDIMPVFTRDVAAVVIQWKWRAFCVRQMLWHLVRVSYIQEWDPVEGRNKYLNLNTRIMSDDKPKLLGGQPWNPNYVPDWSPARVGLFLRRIGLKRYASLMVDYGVDGGSVLMLDAEDYDNMGITSRIHRRKIEVELARIYVPKGNEVTMSTDHAVKREKIKKARIYKESATLIQRVYRGYLARVERYNRTEVNRVNDNERKRVEATMKSASWWLESNPSYRLPPVKEFGRRRDHYGALGWGHFEPGGVWKPLIAPDHEEQAAARKLASATFDGDPDSDESKLRKAERDEAEKLAQEQKHYGDSNPSRIYSEKLARAGYDAKRYAIMRGLARFTSNTKVVDKSAERRAEAIAKKLAFRVEQLKMSTGIIPGTGAIEEDEEENDDNSEGITRKDIINQIIQDGKKI